MTETKKKTAMGIYFKDFIFLVITAGLLYMVVNTMITKREEKIEEYRSQLIGNTYDYSNKKGIAVTVLDEHTLSYTSKEITEPQVMEYEVTVGAITGIARIETNGEIFGIELDKDGKVYDIDFEVLSFFD